MNKKGNKKMHAPRHNVIHNPIPTFIVLVYQHERIVMFISVLEKQICRDGVMNDFVSWCMHLLISFLFHDVTSLHSPSFHRNGFSTCFTPFLIFCGKARCLYTIQ